MSPKKPADCTVGIDYAVSAPHVLSIRWDGEKPASPLSIPPERAPVREALESLVKKAEGGRVRVAFESSGRHLHKLLRTIDGLELHPINPLASNMARRALHVSGVKSDEIDADALRDFLERNGDRLRPDVAPDPASARLGTLCEHRRDIIEQRKATGNRMIDAVRHDFPALATAFDRYSKSFAKLLVAFPDLHALSRKRSSTMKNWLAKNSRLGADKREDILKALGAIDPTAQGLFWQRAVFEARLALLLEKQTTAYDRQIKPLYKAHPLHDLVNSLPGAGPALGPRLCAFLGRHPDGWESAMDMLLKSGIAPVTRKSGGGKPIIRRRRACRTFDIQTFVEFARCSKSSSEWAKNFHAQKRANKMKAFTIYRALAFKWIRIIYACMESGTLYDASKIKSPYAPKPDENSGKTCGKPKSKS